MSVVRTTRERLVRALARIRTDASCKTIDEIVRAEGFRDLHDFWDVVLSEHMPDHDFIHILDTLSLDPSTKAAAESISHTKDQSPAATALTPVQRMARTARLNREGDEHYKRSLPYALGIELDRACSQGEPWIKGSMLDPRAAAQYFFDGRMRRDLLPGSLQAFLDGTSGEGSKRRKNGGLPPSLRNGTAL